LDNIKLDNIKMHGTTVKSFTSLYQVITNFTEILNISYVGNIEEIKVKKTLHWHQIIQ